VAAAIATVAAAVGTEWGWVHKQGWCMERGTCDRVRVHTDWWACLQAIFIFIFVIYLYFKVLLSDEYRGFRNIP